MNKTKYNDKDRVYALSVVERLNGDYAAAARYLKDEGKIAVTAKTLRNWGNDVMLMELMTAQPVQEVVLVPTTSSPPVSVSDIRSEATKGLEAVVLRLNERLNDDRYTKRMNSYELVNIGSFFASLSAINREEQGGSGATTIYQQIINQTYNNGKGD